MSRWIERHWQRITPLSVVLYPLSLTFRLMVALRRAAYGAGVLRTHRLSIPVVVVGNITVGGTGKTPLVLWLTQYLVSAGMQPGIVSRGYGARVTAPHRVAPDSDPRSCGDEPVLLAQRSACPVWTGVDRVSAARALLAAHPDCNIIVSDDGLQHYRLARDVELALVDGVRGLGNRLMLPAGPLREPPSRLRAVDAVVVNGAGTLHEAVAQPFVMRLVGNRFRNLLNPHHEVDAAHFQRKQVRAIAGIGHPARFFAHLSTLGMTFDAQAFPDHYSYSPRDLAFSGADAVVMTEKDAVKCLQFASESHWVLPVDAVPDPELGELVLRKVRSRS